MTDENATLAIVPGEYSICRLPPGAALPDWLVNETFYCMTGTAAETSLICRSQDVPRGVKSESGWRILMVEGRLDFVLTGVLAQFLVPLARAGISVFALSTFDTDYFLIKKDVLDTAITALQNAGHVVRGSP